jgi:hypothetical protein
MKQVISALVVVLMASAPNVSAQVVRTDTLWRSIVGRLAVSVVNRWDTTPLVGAYAVQVIDGVGGGTLEMPLPHARGAVSRIGRWNDRLIVIVRQQAAVIDLTNVTIVDEFRCASPEFSADGRVVTYHPVSASGEIDSDVATYELGPAQ